MKTWSKQDFDTYMAAKKNQRMTKTMAHDDRKFGMHEGNSIRTLFYNYGSIGRPNTEPSLEWPSYSGHGYAYEFGAVVGAEVVDIDGDTIVIFSDGMLDGGEASPGAQVVGWEPLPGYAYAGDEDIAVSNKSETWGDLFPSDEDGFLQWPGQFGNDVIVADMESYYKMDDRYNDEFEYYPVPSDSSIRGLGVEVTVRGYQYAATVAEDIIFFQYEVKNISEKRLEKVVVGMIGDPHIGGGGDFADDYAGFVDNTGLDSYTGETVDVSGMVYAWDKEGSGNDYNIPWEELGWLGFKFLESPGIDNDDIDNDLDGFIDESQYNDFDDDGDWDATDEEALADVAEAKDYWDSKMWNGIDDDGDGRIDDWGDLDGKSDDLNGNGIPDDGEPDYELTDGDESDMLGITSFWAPIYGQEEAQQDARMWLRMKPGTFATGDDIAQEADNIFIFGSGYFSLDPEEIKRFSIALIMGQGKDDLIGNAQVADWIYKLNFNFTKPPDKPNVVAIPGNNKVTLIWDDLSERSVDAVNGVDFEGYKVYRSLVKGEWGDEITNNQGIVVGYIPIAQYDYDNEYEGPHPVPSAEGYHFDMGKNTGLYRALVDTPVVNGLTYYYAVTAYDRGSIDGNLAPLECSRTIGETNVVEVVPNGPVAGYQKAEYNIDHFEGFSDAKFEVSMLDYINLDSDITYNVSIYPLGNDNYIHAEMISLNDTSNDTTVVWDALSLNELYKGWNKILPLGPYEVYILDLDVPSLDSIKWIDSNGQVNATKYFDFSYALSTFGGMLYPRDMIIEFSDVILDTSVFINPQPVRFKAINIDDDLQLDVLFEDNDSDGEVSIGDKITPVFSFNGTPTPSWAVTIDSPFVTPPDGARLKFYTSKPFCTLESTDSYKITFLNPVVNVDNVGDEMDRIKVVPNPYVASSSFEVAPPAVFSMGRGERRVDFIHLPQKCEINIYTIAGDHVKTINHSGTLFDGTESWNLLNSEDQDIAAGYYVYHVKSDGGAEHIGRLAVIK
ncbi:MAG: hypothetical protein ACE5D0_06795 [Fidelibacterota bacterium]